MGLFSFCAENGVRGRAGSWLVPLTFNFPERKRYAVKHNNPQEMNTKNITFRFHTGCRYETAKTKHDACASKGVGCMRHGDRGTVLITLPINMFFCSKARPFCSFRSRFVERRFGPGSLSHFSSGAENLQKKKAVSQFAFRSGKEAVGLQISQNAFLLPQKSSDSSLGKAIKARVCVSSSSKKDAPQVFHLLAPVPPLRKRQALPIWRRTPERLTSID